MLEGREVRELSALNMRAHDAPAGRRDDFIFVERRLTEAEGLESSRSFFVGTESGFSRNCAALLSAAGFPGSTGAGFAAAFV